jgi:hypothetical protein
MATPNNSVLRNAVGLGLGNQSAANYEELGTLGVGIRTLALDAATPLVFPPTVFVVLHTPSMYLSVDNNIMGKTIKTVMETHAKSVSGVDLTYSLETSETPVGHDGQQLQVPTQAKRAAVTPSFTFTEVTGGLIWKLFTKWLTDIQDPDSNASMTRFLNPDLQFMSSVYSMAMVGIQFDPSGLPENIVDAAFYSNMFPTDPGGSLGLERQIATSKTMERTVTFTGHIQHNDVTRGLGVEIAKTMNAAKMAYAGGRKPYYAAMEKELTSSGLKAEIDKLLKA